MTLCRRLRWASTRRGHDGGVSRLSAEDLCCPRRFLRSQRHQPSFGSPKLGNG